MKRNLASNPDQSSKKKRCSFVTDRFKEFCARTDLHGFKYITKKGLSVAERTLWAIVVVMSIVISAFLLVTAYRWYARNPVVTVVETTQGVVWDIPFPAVTLCDVNVVSKSAARTFSQALLLPENVTADFVFATLKLIPLLHSFHKAEPDQLRDLQVLQDVLELNAISIESLFKTLSPVRLCSNIMDRCMWKNTIYQCNQIFRHIFVSVYLCCTFNYYGVKDHGNELKIFSFPTPRRVASCGYQTALTVIVKTEPTDYYSTNYVSLGTLMFVDNAYNVPDMESPMRAVDISLDLIVAVSAERTYATPGIRSFSVRDRECYYIEEVTIPSMNQYSFHNCMALRSVQILQKICHCVPFYFPSNDSNRICNFNDIECLETVTNLTYFQGSNFSDIAEEDQNSEKIIECLPECEHFSYPLQVSWGTLSDRIPLTGIDFYKDVDLKNRSVVNVFFNDLVATRYRRDSYLNWQTVLAAFGGLLCLMLGFTLISVFDFFLFVTLRGFYDTLKKICKCAATNENANGNQGYFINLEEHKKDGWVKPDKTTTAKYKNHQDLERKQTDLLYGRKRY